MDRPKSPAKKKKKGGKKSRKKDDKNFVLNSRGERVSLKELELENSLAEVTKQFAKSRTTMFEEMRKNERLHEACAQQEKDAMEVIAAVHREADGYLNELKKKQTAMLEEQAIFDEEMNELADQYERRLIDMQAVLGEKDAQVKVLQEEISEMKDFRTKRNGLVQEIEHYKAEIAEGESRHREQLAKMDRRFFEEKVKLQKDANRKISELAAKAHKEAIAKLEETTNAVQSENMRMADALHQHVADGEQLHRVSVGLEETNKKLVDKKLLHDVIIKEKVRQSRNQADIIKELKGKIQTMEYTLSHVVREFESERETIGRIAKRDLDEVRNVADHLRRSLQVKSQHMKHIRRMGQTILDQRLDLEKFFMSALEHTRAQIRKEEAQKRSEARLVYGNAPKQSKVQEIMEKESMQRSFASLVSSNPSLDLTDSSSSTFGEVNEDGTGEKNVQFEDVDWVSKENILRLLFGKFNGTVPDSGILPAEGDEECNTP